MYDNHIVFGFYRLIIISDKNLLIPEVQAILNKFPNVTAIAYLSCPEGFVPAYNKEKIG